MMLGSGEIVLKCRWFDPGARNLPHLPSLPVAFF